MRRFRDNKISLATGQVHAKGKISFFIYVRGRRVRTTMYVLPGLLHSLVLARDFISRAKIAIRLHLNGWKYVGENEVHQFEEGQEDSCRQQKFSQSSSSRKSRANYLKIIKVFRRKRPSSRRRERCPENRAGW